ncbi:MAG: hypothetical protein K6G85_04400 [Eubacterium sp.]|nr:hypothetical protein [Eubacterium sp.]
MAYEPYVNSDEYLSLGYSAVPEDERLFFLRKASRQIDTLTFNRIQGINSLTQFQRDVIKEVVSAHADFLYDNQDMLESVLSGYSINGVSMNFGQNWNVHIENGVAIKQDNYSLLQQTGLCCRLVGV